MSATGRGEEQRSSYAIIRSSSVLCDEIDEDTSTPDRIKYLLANGEAAVARKDALIEAIGEETYKAEFDEARKHLSFKGHFKKKRIAGLVDAMVETSEKNKVENARQKTTGMTVTAGNLDDDVIQWKWIYKKEHTEFLKAELRARGYADWKYPADHKKKDQEKTFSDLKNALKAMEKNRVQDETPDDKVKMDAAELGFYSHENNPLEFVKAPPKQKK